MSTVQEIQNAIARLPADERLNLFDWIHSQEEADPAAEDTKLLKMAEEGARQLDEGRGISLEEARKLTSRWTTK
jgi:hypothetical protein